MRTLSFQNLLVTSLLTLTVVAGTGCDDDESSTSGQSAADASADGASEATAGTGGSAGRGGRGGAGGRAGATSEAGRGSEAGSSSEAGTGSSGRGGSDAPGSTPDASTPTRDGSATGDGDDAGAAEDAATPDASSEDDAGTAESDAGQARCGTRGGIECGDGQFCNFEPDVDCGGTDRGGLCEDRPEICTAIFAPVCGCNDRTYSSACSAHAAGVSVQRDGACEPGPEPQPEGATCGGIAALTCEDGQFCNLEESAGGLGCEGIADSSGVCQNTPMFCTRQYQPVCGCDRKSYGNDCEAHSEGVSILHEGACTEIDCAAVGGQVVVGIGPAPMCPMGTTELTYVAFSNGSIPIEGAACCVP